MQEYLKRITIPTADGSRHELSLLTIDDLREPLGKLATIVEYYDVLMSGGPRALAEHLVRQAVSQPPGDYSAFLELAERLCPGTLGRLYSPYNATSYVTARQVADHFPDVVAIVTPADACFVERAQAYVSEGVFFASGGLLLYSRMTNYTQFKHQPVPRNVDQILYWNFSRCPLLIVQEAPCSKLDKEAVPYLPPAFVTGLTNLQDCQSLSLIDSSGRSRLTQVWGTLTFDSGLPVASTTALDHTLRDWAGVGSPHNEIELRYVPTILPTEGMSVNNLFAGLTRVASFPTVWLTGCEGTNLFQRNPDRLPSADITTRTGIVYSIGSKCSGTEPQTDLSGLVNWRIDDMEWSLQNTASKAAVSGWRILLSKDCYARLSSALRATLTAKGFTVVNAG